MVIRSSGGVDRLVAELRHADAARREAAVARLRVLGTRAVDRLVALARSDRDAVTRAAILKALEGINDERGVDLALSSLARSGAEERLAAIAVLRAWVTREEGTRALDALAGLALDPAETPEIRLAALDALSELPRPLIQPLIEHAAIDSGSRAADDPATVRAWLDAHANAPLSALHDLISRIREFERSEAAGRRRDDWIAARGAVHLALARRGSRVALYDLRETLDAARAPLALDFLTALTQIGDASCLEPMARAWAAADRGSWWQLRLADTAHDIVRREHLTGRSAVVKRIRTRWPGFV